MEAGPALPPEDDEDYGPAEEDDEDGRFFGGGVDSTAIAAMDYLDSREKEDGAPYKEEIYDTKWLRGFALKLEKAISKNSELRSKYAADPQKFMASEADLDALLKELSILSEHPELYKQFAELGCVDSLVVLLGHENADVAIDAVQAIGELIDGELPGGSRKFLVACDWSELGLAWSRGRLNTQHADFKNNAQECVKSNTFMVLHSLEEVLVIVQSRSAFQASP